MYTLEINGKNYPLKFGFDFMRKMNKKLTRSDDATGKTENIGLQYIIASVFDDDIEALIDVIMTANATEDEKIDKKDLIDWIENDETDIDAVFEEVKDFFGKANCTKKVCKRVKKIVEELEKTEETKEV